MNFNIKKVIDNSGIELGKITNIGFEDFEYVCPEFITLENFMGWTCINFDDVQNINSWIYSE